MGSAKEGGFGFKRKKWGLGLGLGPGPRKVPLNERRKMGTR